MASTRRFAIALLLSASLIWGQYIQTPPPHWYVVGVGALAARPVTCVANRDVYVCNGAGCTTNGEYHYCTAPNTWTVGSGADDFVTGASNLTGSGGALWDYAARQAMVSPLTALDRTHRVAGPAIINVFAGTVSSAATTVTFSSAADAILAGYDASKPIAGTTIVAAGQTRYVASWTDATHCVVSVAPNPAWVAAAITSTQLPIASFRVSGGAMGLSVAANGALGPSVVFNGNVTCSTDGGCNLGAYMADRFYDIFVSHQITADSSITAGGASGFALLARSRIASSADGLLDLYNNARTAFTRLNFGGTTSSFPGLERRGTALVARLADASAYASVQARSVNFTAQTEGGCVTFADLAVDAVDNTKVTSASYSFVAADVGGIVQVVSGAGWTPGDYTIASISGTAAILYASPAAVGTLNGTFTVNRGRVVMTWGVLGVATDTLRVCSADAAGAMGWRALY